MTAQALYEAFVASCSGRYLGQALLPWDRLTPELKSPWEAVERTARRLAARAPRRGDR